MTHKARKERKRMEEEGSVNPCTFARSSSTIETGSQGAQCPERSRKKLIAMDSGWMSGTQVSGRVVARYGNGEVVRRVNFAQKYFAITKCDTFAIALAPGRCSRTLSVLGRKNGYSLRTSGNPSSGTVSTFQRTDASFLSSLKCLVRLEQQDQMPGVARMVVSLLHFG